MAAMVAVLFVLVGTSDAACCCKTAALDDLLLLGVAGLLTVTRGLRPLLLGGVLP